MKNRAGYLQIFLTLPSICLLPATAGLAQTDAEINAGIQFNFTTPGARSLALGGAFVGRADDATAAFTNPAGLVNLTEPQVSAESRRFTFKNTFTDRGHAFGSATGIGIDTIDGLRFAEAQSFATGLSFLSYAYPRGVSPVFGKGSKPLPRWAFAVYRHELVNFKTAFEARGAFFDYFAEPDEVTEPEGRRIVDRLEPVVASMDIEIVNIGISGAVRLTRGFSLGVGLSLYDFRIDALQQIFSTSGFDPSTDPPQRIPDDAPGALFGPPNLSPSFEFTFQQQTGTDEEVALNLGVFWRLSDRVTLGGVFREGPRFQFRATNHTGALFELRREFPRGELLNDETASFRVPSVFGIGVAIQASPAIRLTLDYNRVRYSTLTERMVSIFGIERPEQQAALDALKVEDGNELRVGFEYVFLDRNPTVYVRFGGWYDPDHKIRFAGEPGSDVFSRFNAALFQGGDDVVHAAAGIGFSFAPNFKIDAAVDFSKTFDVTSLSLVYRFGGRE